MRIRKRLEGLAREALWDCAAAFMIAAGLSVFAAGADFAPGGVNGLSLIIRHLFGLPMGAVSLVLNGPVILMTYKLLGRDFLLKSLKSMAYTPRRGWNGSYASNISIVINDNDYID